MPKKKRGQNEGSIYKGKDGRWRAMIPARFSGTGKRRMIVGSDRDGTNTRVAVHQRLHEALGGRATAIVSSSRETVAGWLSRWLASVASKVRPKTLESYRYTSDKLIIPIIGGIRMQALEDLHVESMLDQLRAMGYAPRTIAYARSVLRIAFKNAEKKHRVARNVVDLVDPPRVPKTEVDAYDAASIAAILAKIDDSSNRLLIATIAAFGLRIGEALGIKWRDVDLTAKTLRIVRAVQRQEKVASERKKGLVFVEVKTARSRRSLLVPDFIVAELKTHRRAQLEHRLSVGDLWKDNDLVFSTSVGTPIDPRNVLRILHRAEAAAKVPRKGLHKLRHSAATILLTRGVPLEVVSDILGHSSIRVTKDTYTQFVVAQQKTAAAVMNEVVGKDATKRRRRT